MAIAGATASPASIRSLKNIKSWREAVKDLPSVDRARILRKNGSVLTLNMVALKKEMEKRDVGQWERPKVAVECSNCGVAHFSRLQCGGDRESRRQCQKLKRDILRIKGQSHRYW